MTEVEIEGVLHEYTTIEGIQEDVTDILLDLKGLAVSLHAKDETTLTLKKVGPGEIRASDITLDHDVEIANPDHLIANLTKVGELSMVMKVVRGRGYKPVIIGGTDDVEQTIGQLKLDASFSPVTRVSYEVQSARVEQRTNLDKLILEIETNGTIDPEDAVREAASILRSQLAVFIDLEAEESIVANQSKEPEIDPILCGVRLARTKAACCTIMPPVRCLALWAVEKEGSRAFGCWWRSSWGFSSWVISPGG